MKNLLLQKIHDKSIVCGVIGLGYVGLPLAVSQAKAGFRTIGFDVQKKKVDLVNAGQNYINDIADNDLCELIDSGRLSATDDFSFIRDVDFVAICVPTPLDSHQQPDISYVKSSAEAVAKYLHKNMIVVLESTTYPGTTDELVRPILEETGLKVDEDFYLGFSPERVDPGNATYKTHNTPKVVGACTPDGREVIASMYESFLDVKVHKVNSPSVAEMTKILENTYRNVNIGLINELAILCNEMNISLWEVIEAASTKPFGFQTFYPGPGLGGHCIPLDPYYLSWKAREYGFHTSMIESSMMVNDRMPRYCAERLSSLLNKRCSKALTGAKILVLGIAYKANIDDYRESPALPLIEHLKRQGAETCFYDPYIHTFRYKYKDYVCEPELSVELLESVDAVIITTAHKCVDYQMVQQHARVIFDTRNAMAAIQDRDNIELL